MGLDVFRHSELPDLTSWEALQRTITESFGDEDDVLMDIAMGLRHADFPVLSRFDPYGDTVLDSRQCATARAEVQELRSLGPGGRRPGAGRADRGTAARRAQAR
ncbi:hypothetical protein ABZX88_31790 [Kitasatospora aureofaciens]|uniref:hypothetical protein n=1 Tax=Kitasatospora aureofaciens TaxID=1894 RepID=UPI0033A5ED41